MKILFIPAYEGEETSERTPQIIHILKEKHELVFLKPRTHWIRKRAFFPLRAWERLQITKALIEEGKKNQGIDLIFCRDTMHALPGYKIAQYLKKPLIWDSEGSLSLFWKDTHKYPTQTIPWMLLEKWLAKRVDYLITITEENKNTYAQFGIDPKHIHIIPICIRSEKLSQKTKEEARASLQLSKDEKFFLFFSNFDYLPNRTALDFINKELAPLLPGTLLLCGKGKLPKTLHPKIRYLGFVPLEKLYDLIRASDVCLAPIWETNGTLTKVLDMLAHGAPTVVTRPIVNRGLLELKDGEHVLIAENQKDFIKKTLHLAQDITLQEKFRRSAPKIILQNYDWRLYKNRLLNLIELFTKNDG